MMPMATQRALKEYLDAGTPPGDFLTAFLSNDLFEAISYADSDNVRCFPDIKEWIICNLPSATYGDRDRVKHWMADRG